MKTASGYWASVAATRTVRECRWTDSEALLAPLRDLDVTWHAGLVRVFPVLTREQQIAAIRLFCLLKVRCAGPLLVTCWLSEDAEMRWEAKGALEDVQSRKAYKRLLAVIHGHANAERREEACYILAFSYDHKLIEPFQQIFADRRLSPGVRAQAAEGLANLLGYVDRRTKRLRETAALLIEGLHDPSPEVRFWACFALGQMRARQALPELRRVAAEDDAACPGWWYVRDEASDAVNNILGTALPDRERIPDLI